MLKMQFRNERTKNIHIPTLIFFQQEITELVNLKCLDNWSNRPTWVEAPFV